MVLYGLCNFKLPHLSPVRDKILAHIESFVFLLLQLFASEATSQIQLTRTLFEDVLKTTTTLTRTQSFQYGREFDTLQDIIEQ